MTENKASRRKYYQQKWMIAKAKRAKGLVLRPSYKRWREQRFKVWVRDNYHCVHCGDYVTFRASHIDHIVPLSAGGKNNLANLRTLCKKCHGLRDEPSHEKLRMKLVAKGIIPVEHQHLLWKG